MRYSSDPIVVSEWTVIVSWSEEVMMAPPKRDTHGVMLRLHRRTLEAIDDLRRRDETAPSRPEIVRRILKAHLKGMGYDVSEWDD